MSTKCPLDGAGSLQWHLGISWPPAERLVNRYGMAAEVVADEPERGRAVPKHVADAVFLEFRKETRSADGIGQDLGKGYQKLDRLQVPRPRRDYEPPTE